MPIDAAKLKQVIASILTHAKELDRELQAHRMLFESMNAAYPDKHLEQQFEHLRNDPAIELDLRRYDELLAKILASIDQAVQDKDFERLLQNWQPKGPQN